MNHRRVGPEGLLLTALLCVPVLVLLGFRVAAAPAELPAVQEGRVRLSTPSTSSSMTPSPTSTPRPTSTPTPQWTSRTVAPPPVYDEDGDGAGDERDTDDDSDGSDDDTDTDEDDGDMDEGDTDEDDRVDD